jgi:ADP-ribose pyrophosphatase
LEVLNKMVKHEGPFLEFVQTRYKDQNGDIKKWDWCRRPGNRKAVVIATIVNQYAKTPLGMKEIPHLVVTKEFRVPIEDYEYGFPAGLIDAGEKPEDAIHREFEEETGLKIVSIDEVTPAIVSSAGLSNEEIYLGFVTAKGITNKDKLESSEDIETFLMTRVEVADLMKKKVKFGKLAYTIMRNFVKYGEI